MITQIDPNDVIKWLKSQKPNKKFVFTEGQPTNKTGCLLCQYLKAKGEKNFSISSFSYLLNGYANRIPEIFIDLVYVGEVFTAKQALQALDKFKNV